MQFGNWVGRDIPIPTTIQKVAKNDDYLSRHYLKKPSGQGVGMYIAYSARPRTMLGHRPQVCYPAVGWVCDGTEKVNITSKTNRKITCLMHRFHRPAPKQDEVVVLNFYIANGQTTDDESVFSGLNWRTPNIDRDPAKYVAQVQISSRLENTVLSAAEDFADLILGYFPDENGISKAD